MPRGGGGGQRDGGHMSPPDERWGRHQSAAACAARAAVYRTAERGTSPGPGLLMLRGAGRARTFSSLIGQIHCCHNSLVTTIS